MEIFLSWSGESSNSYAKELRRWLPMVLQFSKPWMSELDIEAGDRWSGEVSGKLETASYGILCVTPDNLNSPWLLFEAGALAKSVLDGKTTPLLFGVDHKDLTGPLSQFQAKKFSDEGVYDIVRSINKLHSDPIADEQLSEQHQALWENLSNRVSDIPAKQSNPRKKRSTDEILEEIVKLNRSIEIKIDNYFDGKSRLNSQRNKEKSGFVSTILNYAAEHPESINDLNRALQLLVKDAQTPIRKRIDKDKFDIIYHSSPLEPGPEEDTEE